MNAVITGGGADIGGACARLLASRGANVLVVDADLEAAESVAKEINSDAAATAVTELADVSVAADVRRYVAAATHAWRPIDAAISTGAANALLYAWLAPSPPVSQRGRGCRSALGEGEQSVPDR